MLLSSLSLHTEFLPLFGNAALVRKILNWGRESSQQVQDLASKVGGGEQQRSFSPETSLQLQGYGMARYREEGTTHWTGSLVTCYMKHSTTQLRCQPLDVTHSTLLKQLV